MKKVLSLCLALLMVLALTACSGNNVSSQTEGNTPVGVNGAVLLDCDAVKVTAEKMDSDDNHPMLRVNIENKLDQTVFVSGDNIAVNGFMDMSAMFANYREEGASYQQSWEVPAQYSGDDYGLLVLLGMPEDAGIQEIGEIEVTLYAGKEEFNEEYMGEPVTLHVADVEQTYNEDGTVVLDNDQVKIVVRDNVTVQDYIGSCIYIYAYNKTQQRIFITMEGVQANGTEADAAYNAIITPGKRDVSMVSFYGLDPAAALTEVKATFVGKVFDDEDDFDGQEIFRSDAVTLRF